jgi:hypothetical protein
MNQQYRWGGIPLTAAASTPLQGSKKCSVAIHQFQAAQPSL